MRLPLFVASTTLTLAMAATVTGCQTLNDFAVENPKLTCGTSALFTGGATWALCHYGLSGDQTTCIMTAVAVAAADGLVCYWNLKQKLVQDYEQTQKALGYDPGQGYVIRILDFSATPKLVKPGEKVVINAQFALMSPDRNEEISFERKIILPGDNKPRVQKMTYQPGTWGVEGIPFDIDANTPDGKVQLTLEISLPDHNKSDVRTLCFNIAKDGQVQPADQCSAENVSSSQVQHKTIEWFAVANAKKPLRLRDQPSTKAKSGSKVPGGFRYPVLEKSGEGNKTWYQIRLTNQETGWVQSAAGELQVETQ